MNYTLSSSRKIGSYTQKIITNQINTTKATSSSYLNTLKTWHNLISNLDPSGRTVGTIQYKGFSESYSEQTDNTGTKADVLVTVISTSTGKPKTTTFKCTDVTSSNLTDTLNATYLALTGDNINASTSYITSVIISLK